MPTLRGIALQGGSGGKGDIGGIEGVRVGEDREGGDVRWGARGGERGESKGVPAGDCISIFVTN